MEHPQKMDVVDWQDSPLPAVVKTRNPRRFLSPTLIGILGTLLLHALVIQSVPWGRGPKLKAPETAESADALSMSNTDSAESLVLISLPTLADSTQAAVQRVVSSLPDLKKMKIKPTADADPPATLNIESLALREDQAARLTIERGDGAELARLFGIYTGQIRARIARVWRRPRTPVNDNRVDQKQADTDESFQCEAQVVQDVRGNVQEILLPRCNGSPAWQRSLVLAIQHASPLPAPPSDNVFSASITLNFVGLSYFAGAPEDEYELEQRTLTSAQ
jgi:hypothetical protein